MANIRLKINGRDYDMACDDGQEERIYALSQYVDSRLSMIASAGAGKSEAHLLMLTSLVLADEIFDLKEGLPVNSDTTRIEAEKEQALAMVESLIQRVETLSASVK